MWGAVRYCGCTIPKDSTDVGKNNIGTLPYISAEISYNQIQGLNVE